MGASSRAVVVVDVNRGFLGQLSRGDYNTSMFSSAAVDPVAVQAVQGPGQRKHVRTLRHELDYNPRGAPFECVAVFDKSRQGKQEVAMVWHVCNISHQHLHETVSGPKDKVNVTISFDLAF